MSQPSPWVVRFAARIRAGGTVLDLAAGAGRHTRHLRSMGYRVVAVDRDVSKLDCPIDDGRVEIVEADLEREPWPFDSGHFDGVVVTNYLHRPLLPTLADALREGGVLIYETFAEGNERYGRPSNPAFLLREGELADAFASSLTLIEHEQVDDGASVRQRIYAVREGRPSANQST